ncbi:CHC2 zinc finger domain-containing protein [Saccharothrix sp. HUAS TT1]|uniref:CHC2 zinc finger domain-containing protein n=1 Tax=unclassified Saccharothrix TaxID=2593673 RepID=UPI00345C2710
MTDAPIARLLVAWFPDWEPPPDRAEWNPCLCPFHGEEHKSASVSYENNAFSCKACDMRGDIIALIKRKEGCGYRDAVERAEKILDGSDQSLPQRSDRKPRRRVFGESGIPQPERKRKARTVPPWLRK